MKWALMLTFMWVCQFANAQDFVKGKVIDQAGEPVTGAYVRWKDTKIGASTDVDGNFSIPAHQGKLVISFLGYKTKEVSAQSGKQIEVKLEEDAQHLDEFVVIGYGLQKKSSITGSIETIKADDLLMMPTANLDNALTGQVAGLQVMASTGDPSTAKEAALHIRGINSAPLLVIDGVPRFGTTTSDGETLWAWQDNEDIAPITNMAWTSASPRVNWCYQRLAYDVTLHNQFISEQTGKLPDDEIAEIRFLRALNYFEFLDLFRRAPFKLEFNGELPEEKVGVDLYKWIDEELTTIEPMMKEVGAYCNSKDFGRADRGAAYALHARLALNAPVLSPRR